MKRALGSVLLLVLLALTAGCWDRNELEELGFVVLIGLDKGEKENQIVVTYQIANPIAGVPNLGGGNQPSREVVTFPSPDFLSARDLANVFVSRQITYSHTRILVVSEELARTEQFWPVIASSLRDRELRREISLIVSREKAADFIRGNKPVLEVRNHKFYDYMSVRWGETGLVPDATLHRLFEATQSQDHAFLAIYATAKKQNPAAKYEDDYLPGEIDKKGGNPVQVIGSALFKEGRMISGLTGEETRIVMQINKKLLARVFLSTYEDPMDPKQRIVARLLANENSKVRLDLQANPPTARITVPFDIEILSIPSGYNYVTDINNQQKLRESIEKSLEQKYRSLIDKAQNEYKVDPFNWALEARRLFPTLQAYEHMDWNRTFSRLDVAIEVEATIKGFGKQLTPAIRRNHS